MIEWIDKGKVQSERVAKSLRCQVMLNQDDVEMFVSILNECHHYYVNIALIILHYHFYYYYYYYYYYHYYDYHLLNPATPASGLKRCP